MHEVARVLEDDGPVPVGVPAEVVDVQMREEDDVDVLRSNPCVLKGSGQEALALGSPPLPQPGRADTRVEQQRLATHAEQVDGHEQPPGRAVEEFWIERAIGLPLVRRGPLVELDELPEHPDRVSERDDLDVAQHRAQNGRNWSGEWATSERSTSIRTSASSGSSASSRSTSSCARSSVSTPTVT